MNMLSLAGAVQEAAAQVTETVHGVVETSEAAAAQVVAVAQEAAPQAEAARDWAPMLWTALICIVSVFFVLVLLIFVMKLFGVIFTPKVAKNAAAAPAKPQSGQIHEEEIAAIATALRLFSGDLHDRESEVLTIMNIKRAYSPWNSKIHGLTQLPDRKF